MRVNKRNAVIVVSLLVILAVLTLGDDDEPRAPVPDNESRTAQPQQRPRIPPPGSEEWYGRRRQYPSAPAASSDQPPRPPSAPGQPEQRHAGPYGQPRGYAEAPAAPPERYQFRPLTEQERQRMERSSPAPAYPGPYEAVPEPRIGTPPDYARPADPGAYPGRVPGMAHLPRPDFDSRRTPTRGQAPEPAWSRPSAPEWSEGYSFRPTEPSPAASDRWQGSRQDFGWWDSAPEGGSAWTPPGEGGWHPAPPAAMPPAERMYPSLPEEPDRRFTYR